MAKLVFRKSLWEQAMLELGFSEQYVKEWHWPDTIDNLEVEHFEFIGLGKELVGRIGQCIVSPKWCEIVNVERKCKK